MMWIGWIIAVVAIGVAVWLVAPAHGRARADDAAALRQDRSRERDRRDARRTRRRRSARPASRRSASCSARPRTSSTRRSRRCEARSITRRASSSTTARWSSATTRRCNIACSRSSSSSAPTSSTGQARRACRRRAPRAVRGAHASREELGARRVAAPARNGGGEPARHRRADAEPFAVRRGAGRRHAAGRREPQPRSRAAHRRTAPAQPHRDRARLSRAAEDRRASRASSRRCSCI